MSSSSVTPTIDFLIRAAREFRRGGWVFTGFHWPVLAGQLAHALTGEEFVQVFEAGVSTHEAGRLVPTSTTDYPAYANAMGLTSDTASVLLAMARRFDRVVLDASNIDVLGRVNSSMIGDSARPKVRLPGGGGAADVAAAASELVWLHGGDEVTRIHAQVEHVTAAPGSGARVCLHTRWGSVRLGADPQLEELADTPGADAFAAHLDRLGVRTTPAHVRVTPTMDERYAAADVLHAAAERGYAVAQRATSEMTSLRRGRDR